MKPNLAIFDWYFSKKALPYWMVLLADCLIIVLSAYFVYWMFYRGASLQLNFWHLLGTIGITLIVYIIFFRIFHTYSGIIRYSSFVDLQRVAEANVSAGFVIWALHYFYNSHIGPSLAPVETRLLVLAIVFETAVMWMERLILKVLFDNYGSKKTMNVLIYGSLDGGSSLAKMVSEEKPQRFNVRGFISHDPSFSQNFLLGKRIYPADAEIPKVLERLHIEAVLVAPKRNELFRGDKVLQDNILNSGVKIFMAQDPKDWNDKDTVATLSQVKIEDLLPRQQIQVDLDSIAAELSGKRIMITGSAGSIGSEIVRQIATFHPAELMLIDQAETPQHDIRRMMAKDYPEVKAQTVVTSIDSQARMRSIFETFKPEYVFHAAAYKHVPMMEDNPATAIHNNVRGTRNIADLSVEFGVKKFVMISTDKAVNPTNVMGCSKRICEIYVQSLNKAQEEGKVKGNTQFVTTRFGNVLGSNGSVIPIFQKQIADGGPVTVTHPDIIRFFMLIPEACKLVLEAGTKGNGGEIFVFDMGNPVKIADLAKRMIALSGARNVEIKYTGLRDGEKLYEEVLNEQETTKPSFHEKIRIASVRQYDYSAVRKDIEELISIANSYDAMAVVRKMKQIVPEYKSRHSVYEILD